jgi:hypothetical protein
MAMVIYLACVETTPMFTIVSPFFGDDAAADEHTMPVPAPGCPEGDSSDSR